MVKFIKWLQQNKKRHYKIVYVAVGFMGNKYDVATIEFKVSDRKIKNEGFTHAAQWGFYVNYKLLSRHYKIDGKGLHNFISTTLS